MDVTLKIYRYNPEKDQKWHYETYSLEAEPTDRVLDLLEKVKAYNDGTLSFRRSCAHGVCGSDAMRINGRNYLACKALVKDFGEKITVEPILGLKVIKDLIVDMEPFFDNYKKVLPFFIKLILTNGASFRARTQRYSSEKDQRQDGVCGINPARC
jgi:succinate dehydrogenase / fumarate reductase, iron-sulfur subunit